MKTPSIRQNGYVEFKAGGQGEAGWRVWRARGKTFLVEWCEAGSLGSPLSRDSDDERIVIFPRAGGTIKSGSEDVRIHDRTIAIVPPGPVSIACQVATTVILLSPLREGDAVSTLNDADYPDAGPEGMLTVAPGSGQAKAVQVIPVDHIVPPADKPRLKIVRSGRMSVSWIEYEGVRDRTSLSPHHHDDFEQGSLAIEGDFIHHLRTPWGPDATAWRDDIHLHAAERSLCVIPPRVIHTTEGEGDGKHILIDIFAPAREDFVSKGWVFNSAAYS